MTSGPDFSNLLKILRREEPDRSTLFELFLNDSLYDYLNSSTEVTDDRLKHIPAFFNAGYDYATLAVPGFHFPAGEVVTAETKSINAGAVIQDRASFDAYPWPRVSDIDTDFIEKAKNVLPSGMKFVVLGPMGVLENAVKLVGYQQLCTLLIDDPKLVGDIFEQIGRRLAEYYKYVVQYSCVGACISNDDWGFRTQTMLSPRDLRRFVFPWHKEIVQNVHQAGKPVILHCCGYFDEIIDDVIDEMAFDGRHSYEDTIVPVEEAYERYHDRIAILGGIDMNFLCRATPDEVFARSQSMLQRADGYGGYALGSGNSVPEYVPRENYLAMIEAAKKYT